jgi:small-conductance mechanosensitive channel
VGIGYEDDIEAAKKVIQEILDRNAEIIRDEFHENFVIEDELAASTVNLKVFFWVDTVDYRRASRVLRGLIIKEVKEALAAKDFNLPSDVVELKLYKNTPEIPFKISGNAENELPKK